MVGLGAPHAMAWGTDALEIDALETGGPPCLQVPHIHIARFPVTRQGSFAYSPLNQGPEASLSPARKQWEIGVGGFPSPVDPRQPDGADRVSSRLQASRPRIDPDVRGRDGFLVRSGIRIQRQGLEGSIADQLDPVIQPGDLIHVDCGVGLTGIFTDQQKQIYMLRPGASEPRAGLQVLFAALPASVFPAEPLENGFEG